MVKRIQDKFCSVALLSTFAWILFGACGEFYSISWGTGDWWGEFSLKWGLAFCMFVIFSLLWPIFIVYAIRRPSRIELLFSQIVVLRRRMGMLRWLPVVILVIFPIWFFQYTSWGVIISGNHLRLLIWLIIVCMLAVFVTSDKMRAWTWSTILVAVFLTAVGFFLGASLRNVTMYPFNLGWSEGNRMWDYSLLFGSDLYNYPPDNPPVAYLDFGRQLSGGLPFLFGEITILQERLWLGLMTIVPYVVLGWIAFFLPRSSSKLLPFIAGLWAWMFLSQGPIHAPLLWCALLVALAWERPVWLAFPIVALAAYFATISRDTWVFAPAMWVIMLELGSAALDQNRRLSRIWLRLGALGVAGLAGIPFSYRLVGIGNWMKSLILDDTAAGGAPSISPGAELIPPALAAVTDQPLLWYRLFPNATYGNGILLGLLIAALPLVVMLVYLNTSRTWILNIWQKLALVLPLSAFLIVGLIVSTKIGGGGDLHNMDMFLIGLMFTAALAWRGGGAEWLLAVDRSPIWVRSVLMLMLMILGFRPLMTLHPIKYSGDAEWLARLTDVSTIRALDLLPSDAETKSVLEVIRGHVEKAEMEGDVLFMDQRQLLTFGYIRDIQLLWEYEKKWMMDKALSGDVVYFEPFYRDLADHRFSLIISDPLRAPIKDSGYEFGEENNAWVKWVAVPILCYYEPIKTMPDFRVQLLAPKSVMEDCTLSLPQEVR